MNDTRQPGLRCHDADACALGPKACGCEAEAQPDASRLIEALSIEIDAGFASLLEIRSEAELRRQHARITELEANESDLLMLLALALEQAECRDLREQLTGLQAAPPAPAAVAVPETWAQKEAYERCAQSLVAKYGFCNWQCEEADAAGALAATPAQEHALGSVLSEIICEMDELLKNDALPLSLESLLDAARAAQGGDKP